MTSLTSRQLGNYVLGPLIGRGGMGEVYAATHRFLGTEFAVKTLRGLFADNESVANRFFLEARAAVEIAHPNVVRVLDFGKTDDGTLYLVMERLHGRSLAAEIARGPISVASAVYIATLVCEGLGAAHGKGIIHRDLKPDNVFLTQSELKILDFGIARVLSQVSATSQGAIIGTPLYMAPEQTRSSQHVGPTSDVYSLGAMLFEMLTGRPPFIGETASQLIASHLFEPPPKVSQLMPIDRKLDRIVERCLAKAPEGRPQSMKELAELLAPFVPARPSLPPMPAPSPEPAHPYALTDDVARMATGHLSSQRVGQSSTLSGAAMEVRGPLRQPPKVSAIAAGAAAAIALSGIGIAAMLWRASKAPTVVAHARPADPMPTRPSVVAPQPVVPAQAAELVLRTTPPDATVKAGDEILGRTPLAITHVLPLTVTYSLRGYHDEVVVVGEPGEHSTPLARTQREHGHATPTSTPAAAPAKVGEGLD